MKKQLLFCLSIISCMILLFFNSCSILNNSSTSTSDEEVDSSDIIDFTFNDISGISFEEVGPITTFDSKIYPGDAGMIAFSLVYNNENNFKFNSIMLSMNFVEKNNNGEISSPLVYRLKIKETFVTNDYFVSVDELNNNCECLILSAEKQIMYLEWRYQFEPSNYDEELKPFSLYLNIKASIND